MSAWKGIIGQQFTPDEFDVYVAGLTFIWKPEFVVLHNTGSPSLAQRPRGLTRQHIANLEAYYKGQGWSAGPHLFCDQNEKGIWVFTSLTTPGVHAPSWNSKSWGVEMLGDYETELFGEAVQNNAVRALAALHKSIGLDPQTLHLHREDPKTTHKTCPGKHVDKTDIIQRIVSCISLRK